MTEQISPKQFHEAAGVEDWRMLYDGAYAYFRTGLFAAGARLVQAISELAGLEDHHPDVDVRYGGVTVCLITLTHDDYGMSECDLGLLADPSAVQTVQVTIDALVGPEVLPFWCAVLDYQDRADSPEDLIDPRSRGSSFWFQQMAAPRQQRNRIHVDVWVPHDLAEARVAAAIAAGDHLVSDEHAPAWWTLADAEGNEFDVATWMGRD